MTIEDLCHELNNWFDEDGNTGAKNRYFGEFQITDGVIDLSGVDIADGQYFRIVGSRLNDGVYTNPAEGLHDEVFSGAVWVMAVPRAVLSLVEEIGKWEAKYGGAESQAASPFTSESFGGYSYSKSAGSSSDGSGDAGSWQAAFHSRLNRWRKVRNV